MDARFPNLDDETRDALVEWLRERARFHSEQSETSTNQALVDYDIHAMGALGDAADALKHSQYEMSPWPEV